jgi:hypothetical protein
MPIWFIAGEGNDEAALFGPIVMGESTFYTVTNSNGLS